MATETVDARWEHIRGVTVTAIASLAGISAALVSSGLASGGTEAASDPIAMYVLGVFIVLQLPLFRIIGIDVGEFSIKDYLYVAFMTFALWFVTWGILLTSETAVTF